MYALLITHYSLHNRQQRPYIIYPLALVLSLTQTQLRKSFDSHDRGESSLGVLLAMADTRSELRRIPLGVPGTLFRLFNRSWSTRACSRDANCLQKDPRGMKPPPILTMSAPRVRHSSMFLVPKNISHVRSLNPLSKCTNPRFCRLFLNLFSKATMACASLCLRFAACLISVLDSTRLCWCLDRLVGVAECACLRFRRGDWSVRLRLKAGIGSESESFISSAGSDCFVANSFCLDDCRVSL